MATPLEQCIASVEERRRAKGNDKALNTHATVMKHGLVARHVPRFRAEGLRVEHLEREEAFLCVKEALGL